MTPDPSPTGIPLDGHPYRAEVFTAEDGEPGVRLVWVTQAEYQALAERLTLAEQVAAMATETANDCVAKMNAARRIAQEWVDKGSSYATCGRRILGMLPARNYFSPPTTEGTANDE